MQTAVYLISEIGHIAITTLRRGVWRFKQLSSLHLAIPRVSSTFNAEHVRETKCCHQIK